MFTTQRQLEQRASFHSKLLKTTNQINQLIVRSKNPIELIQQACDMLAERLDNGLVWIVLCHGDQIEERPITKAGQKVEILNTLSENRSYGPRNPDPIQTAIRTRHAVIHRLTQKISGSSAWNPLGKRNQPGAVAAFPMRYSEQVLGALCVSSQQQNTFDEEDELTLLQQLSDDLAYAMISLEARTQQAFLHTATETMPDGLIITDLDGCIIYANPAIASILKYAQGEITGRNIYAFMSAEQGAETIDYLFPTLRKDGQLQIEIEIFDKYGEPVFTDLTFAMVYDARKEPINMVVNVRDSTRRRLFEHRLLSLNRFTTELVQIHDPDELFSTILQACEELLQADASAISLGASLDPRKHEIHGHNIPEICHLDVLSAFSRLPGSDEASTRNVIHSENISDAVIDFSVKENLLAQGFKSLFLLPIHYQNLRMGMLGLYFKSGREFDEATLQIGSTVTHTLAIVLQNARLYQSEHSQRRFAEAIVQATQALNSSLDLDLVLDQILEETWRVVPCRSVNLMLVEGDHAQVMRQVTRSESGEIERISGGPILPLSTPTLHRMVKTGEPVLISDTRDDPEWHTLERSAWIRCYASAPLQIRQEVIGFLNINSAEPNYFDEESIQRLQAFASHAAAALHNARLYSDLQVYSHELAKRVEERTAQLSLAKNRIEAILESVPDAVFVLDSDDKLLESNQAGTSLLIQNENALTTLFNPQLMALLRSGEAPDEKAIVELNRRIYQALSSPIPLPEQQAGLVVVYRDVTRFQELDRMKTQFVSDVSHELRTPLANLTLFLDLLSDEKDDLKRKRYQETLRRETNRLTELIEDLLTISRLESHKVSFFIQEVDVIELIHDLIVDRNRMARNRELILTFEPPTGPILGEVDPRQLTQVLSNILTNAFNYTPAGGQIKVTAEKTQDRNETWITISISDNGYGIQAEEMAHIFERFYRGSASRMTSAPGTGLGLAISQEILERMGGRITVKSETGVGSSFTVWVQSVL